MPMKLKPGTGQIGSFPTTAESDDALAMARAVATEYYDFDLEIEFHSSCDKPPLKLIPCTVCKRPMVVNTFYVLGWAKCHGSGCSGESRGPATVAVAQAGKTEPSQAVNLAECLINPQFAEINCLLCGEPMELKHVNHCDRYGPGEWRQGKDGPYWEQTAKGETVLHQCNNCLCTTSFSTTAQHIFRRINEVRPGKHVNGIGEMLGAREPILTPDDHVALRNMGFEDV